MNTLPFNQTEDFLQEDSRNTSMTDNDAVTNAWAITLAVLGLIAFCWMTKRQPIPRDAILRARMRAIGAEEAEDPEDRKLRIEKALTVQKVIGCDKDGNLQLGSTVHEDADEEKGCVVSGAPCHDSTPTESSTCCICLEVYQVGETVAWNRKRRCLHVFHQECLAGWLEKHNDCPSCRLPIIAKKNKEQPNVSADVETPPEEPSESTIAERNDDDDNVSVASASSSSGAFAIVQGLIARVRDGLSNKQQQQTPASSSSPTIKMEMPSPTIFRRRVISFSAGETNWSPVRGRSSSTSNETSDEEECSVAPLRRAVSVNDTSCLPEDGKQATLQIVQNTQPWMTDSLLHDDDEEDIIMLRSTTS